MKKLGLLFLVIVWITIALAQEFVSPIDFLNTDENKQKVVIYIKENVKESCASIGITDPATLRMMENKNLTSFKKLIKATDPELLQALICQYSSIGLDDYATILMMYDMQMKAKKQELKW